MQQHRTITAHLQPAGLRVDRYQGREHLVVPVVLAVAGIVVHPATGDGQGELITADALKAAPSQWDGRPVIPGHPPTGSANTPQRLEGRQFGVLFGTRFANGRLQSEAWLDVARAQEVGPDAVSVVDRLRKGQMIEVSVGAWVTLEDVQGTANGKAFARRWLHVASDHLAMLEPGQAGACSTRDGCGAGRTALMAAHACAPTADDVLDAIARTQYERECRRVRLAALQSPPPNGYAEGLKKLGMQPLSLSLDSDGVPQPYSEALRRRQP